MTDKDDDIDGLVQDCSNSSASAMELLQYCTEPSIWWGDDGYGDDDDDNDGSGNGDGDGDDNDGDDHDSDNHNDDDDEVVKALLDLAWTCQKHSPS